MKFNEFYSSLEATSWQINFQDPATPIAGRIIEIHHHVFFFLLIVLIFVFFIIWKILNYFYFFIPKFFFYRKKNKYTKKKIIDFKRLYLQKLSNIKFTHNTIIEIIWTSIPSAILIFIAIPSFGLLYAMDDIMDPEITLKAIGHQWYWSYEYSDYIAKSKNNQSLIFDSYMLPDDELLFGDIRLLEVDNTIILPLRTFVRINISSSDVLHSWAIPSLGVKVDAVPSRINSAFVFFERTGTFYGQCSEICGVNHGFMPIVLKAVNMNSYLKYLNSNLL